MHKNTAEQQGGADKTLEPGLRQQQDLECLSMLKEAYELRKEAEYIDRMFSSLKHEEPVFDPAVEKILKQLDE